LTDRVRGQGGWVEFGDKGAGSNEPFREDFRCSPLQPDRSEVIPFPRRVDVNVADLNLEAKVALIGLLAHMVDADGRVAEEEAVELLHLGDEMRHNSLAKAVERSRKSFASRDALLHYAGLVEDDDARALIRTVLIDLSNADGFRGRNERVLIDDLIEAWAHN